MSKNNIYEEALADVKLLKEIAEKNAQQKVLEALAPRISRLIEEEMLSGEEVEDDSAVAPAQAELLSAPPGEAPVEASPTVGISPPDAEGKVTLDLDALQAAEQDEQASLGSELDATTEATDDMLFDALSGMKESKIAKKIISLKNEITKLNKASKFIKRSSGFIAELKRINGTLENTYDRIQEKLDDSNEKLLYNECLEIIHCKLNKIQENTMKQRRLVEEDELDALDVDVEDGEDASGADELTLRLSGLNGVDADDVDVDVLGGEGDEEEEESFEMEDDAEFEDSGDEEGDDEDLDDDEVVEIDESVLRREIARMRRLKESQSLPVSSKKLMPLDGPEDGIDDFGGADLAEADEIETDDEIVGLEEMDTPELEEMCESARRALRKLVREGKSTRKTAIVRKAVLESARILLRRARLVESRQARQASRLNSERRLSEKKKLSVSNLNSMKLRCENAILKSALPQTIKRQAIKRINECKSVDAIKATYETIRDVASKQTKLSESRIPAGSSSRPTRTAQPAQTSLNESVGDTKRWAVLAGIVK